MTDIRVSLLTLSKPESEGVGGGGLKTLDK